MRRRSASPCRPSSWRPCCGTGSGHAVDIKGAVKEKAFIRELQWDPFGVHVLHADFTRVSADERIEIEVPVVLRGETPA